MSLPWRPRRPRTVRLRTAFAACLALAPVLLVVSVAGVVFQRHQLTAAVELVAEDQALTVADSVAGPGRRPPVSSLSALGGEATLIQVVDASGHVVDASGALEGHGPLLQPRGDATRSARVSGAVEDEDDQYQVVLVPTDDNGLFVAAARSLEDVDAATSSTIGLLAVGDPLLVLLVGGLSYLLAGRALRPVEALRREAAAITAADLSARLPEPGAGDEIDRLAVTLNAMLARLEHSARAQRQFVADASHELRSPVAAIRTLHEVAEATPERSDWVSVSREVLAETGRLERLVADLLLLARSTAAAPRAASPVDLTAVVVGEAARARRLRVRCETAPGVVVTGHHDRLARALRNLLDNAERHATSTVSVDLVVSSDWAVVTVRDDGPGIAAGDRERVFERFVRLDEARARDHGGAGLGLAITRHLVEEHQGTVRIIGTPPAAVFVMTLPLAPSRETDR